MLTEFKKSKAQNYGLQHGSSDSTKSKSKEWQVLYTTQVMQKAKKYHDGYLELAICGSWGRQVTLDDCSQKLLDSRFLKKDKQIASGKSFAFDGHLVDIGDAEGVHDPQMDLSGSKVDVITKTVNEACLFCVHECATGYTKVLASSLNILVMLYDTSWKLLNSRFLKKDERITSGESLAFDGHLVDIGEPEGVHEPLMDLNGHKGKVKAGTIDQA
ncbi:protein of unknown function DUF2439, partial [Dillenia turbinata]